MVESEINHGSSFDGAVSYHWVTQFYWMMLNRCHDHHSRETNVLFYKILQESKLLNIDKITIIDIMDNGKLLQEFNFQKSMKLNFQMYNYHHPKSIDKKKFAYNIL